MPPIAASASSIFLGESMLRIKRVYEKSEESDGIRILVDRLWPRGLSKAKAKIDVWMKDIAPSTELRNWFGHEHQKWQEFEMRYKHELAGHMDMVKEIAELARKKTVTLVYGSRDTKENNAVVLADYIQKHS